MSLELNALRRTASRVLAAAVTEVFPSSLLIDGRDHQGGFYYDFSFPFVFQKEFIALIEEKMRALVKSGTSIDLLEMMPANAGEFLRHHKQPNRAQMAVEHSGMLIEIFQMAGFVDPCPGPYLSNVDEIKAFRLYDATQQSDQTVRIWGTAFFSVQELKDHFRGKSKKKPPAGHIELGTQMDLFSSYQEKFWRWHPKGERIKQIFLNLWRKWHQEEGFHFLSTPHPSSALELTQAHLDFTLKRPSISFPYKIAEMNHFTEEGAKAYEGLLASKEYSADVAHIFCDEETLLQNTISSLQFMRKFSKLFPFEVKWALAPSQAKKKKVDILKRALEVLEIDYSIDERKKPANGPEVSLLVQDGLGREWSLSTLRLESLLLEKVGFQGALIVRSLFSSVERWIALLLERTQGELPFWLSSEHGSDNLKAENEEGETKESFLKLVNQKKEELT
ncbi:MAG TPA: hypothetical protein VLG76_00670 [Rhabdochlamydiaceae bacterium]|nr:hypothetical protein [Rhabdochlamydiaceae bacterium]